MTSKKKTAKEKEIFTVKTGKDDKGTPIFSVLVKRTYDIVSGEVIARSEKTQPFVMVDSFYDHGDPEWSTVQYESDLMPYKLATDVVLIGRAYAPNGRKFPEIDISLAIGKFNKVIRVVGNRHCIYREGKDPVFSEPVEFSDMQIRYEKAYGGMDEYSNPNMPFHYPRNPLGVGLAVKNIRESIEGLVLPNFEDLQDLLTPDRVVLGDLKNWNKQPLPQGYGWYQKTWYPRCSFVGSVPGFVDPDEVMREETLGIVPERQIALSRQFKLPSYDVRFNNGASLGLVLPYLKGDEVVNLFHLTPEGKLSFWLPDDNPSIMLDIGLGENQLDVKLHTVCIRAEDKQVDLTWCGVHPYPGFDWLPQMKKMVAEVK